MERSTFTNVKNLNTYKLIQHSINQNTGFLKMYKLMLTFRWECWGPGTAQILLMRKNKEFLIPSLTLKTVSMYTEAVSSTQEAVQNRHLYRL